VGVNVELFAVLFRGLIASRLLMVVIMGMLWWNKIEMDSGL